jgi:hypothetical protein
MARYVVKIEYEADAWDTGRTEEMEARVDEGDTFVFIEINHDPGDCIIGDIQLQIPLTGKHLPHQLRCLADAVEENRNNEAMKEKGKKDGMRFAVAFGGNMAVLKAKDIAQARKRAAERFGSVNAPFDIKEAADEDIAWFQAMGGRVLYE